jgi:hypothetical protein
LVPRYRCSSSLVQWYQYTIYYTLLPCISVPIHIFLSVDQPVRQGLRTALACSNIQHLPRTLSCSFSSPKTKISIKVSQCHIPHGCTFLFGQRGIPGVLEDPEAEVHAFENVGFSRVTETSFPQPGASVPIGRGCCSPPWLLCLPDSRRTSSRWLCPWHAAASRSPRLRTRPGETSLVDHQLPTYRRG